MNGEKTETVKEIQLPNQESIRTFVEKENYMYMWILEVDIIKQTEMKEKIRVLQKNKKTSRNQTLQ